MSSPPPQIFITTPSKINKVKNKVDGQSSRLLAYIQVSYHKIVLTLMHLAFLELDTHPCHLYFKLFNENRNVIIPRLFYLQPLSKDYECIK